MITNIKTGEILENNPGILPELQELLSPLRQCEIDELTASITTEGIRDPLVVWKERDVLLDGHNRLGIAKNNQLDYSVTYISLPSIEAAKRWIVTNQLGRRNLTRQRHDYYIGWLYEQSKGEHGAPHGNQNASKKQSGQNDHSVNTSESIAEQTGVSEKTIRRDAEYAKAIDKLAEIAGPEVRENILSGKSGLSKKDVKEAAETIAEEAPDLIPEMAAGNMSISQAKREIVKRKRQNAPPLPEPESGKYRVLYADPPWKYNDSGVINDDNYGRAQRHYTTMSIQELCDLSSQIKDISESNAVLFMWCTSPFLEDVFTVINAWGFKYKTSFVWDKVKHNFGHYNSVRHEMLLVCTRGSCTPDNLKLFDSVQSIERTEKHSEKPHEFRDIIDTLYTHGKRIELFAREKHDNWDVWGNEID